MKDTDRRILTYILYDTVIKDMPSLKETIENLLNK